MTDGRGNNNVYCIHNLFSIPLLINNGYIKGIFIHNYNGIKCAKIIMVAGCGLWRKNAKAFALFVIVKNELSCC